MRTPTIICLVVLSAGVARAQDMDNMTCRGDSYEIDTASVIAVGTDAGVPRHDRLALACCTMTYHTDGASHFVPTIVRAPCPANAPKQSFDLCATVARSLGRTGGDW